VKLAFTFIRLATPATLQIFSVEAIAEFVKVTIVSLVMSPAATETVAVPPARLLETSALAGNVETAETLNAGELVSVTVRFPAGTVIGCVHPPTGTVCVDAYEFAPASENVKLPVRVDPVAAALQSSMMPVARVFVNVTVTVPDTSADAGTLTVAVRPVRLDAVSAEVGMDEIALTFENVDAASVTVTDPAVTATGALHRPVPTTTGLARPLTENENCPVTAGLPDALQISMNPDEVSVTAACAAREAVPANEGAANNSPATHAAHRTSRLFM